MSILSQGKAYLNNATISGVPNSIFNDGKYLINFSVKSVYIYEDICKPHFTGTMIIESFLNFAEQFLKPNSPVTISIRAPREDKENKIYTENFFVYGYKTRVVDIEAQGRVEITIDLIGEEFYRDKHNSVVANYSNMIGTSAARIIHSTFVAENGGLRILEPSKGMIGQDDRKHEVRNLHPYTAIRQILLRCVFAGYPTCAPVYYRDKPGYVMSPLQKLLETAKIANSFEERPAEGSSFLQNIMRYDNILELKQEYTQSSRSYPLITTHSFNITGGKFDAVGPKGGINNTLFKSNKKLFSDINSIVEKVSKGQLGAKILYGYINDNLQAEQVTKAGKGGYEQAQQAFLSALDYSPRYTIKVPLQGGIFVTCGNRISVKYPVNDRPISRTLFVPRLVHKLEMVTTRANLPGHQQKREPESYAGTTELTALYWE